MRSSWMVPSASGSASASLTSRCCSSSESPSKLRAGDGHLEVVARARAVLHVQLGRVGKRLGQQGTQAVGRHAAMLDQAGGPGSGRTTTVPPAGITSVTGRSARCACSRIFSSLEAW